MIRPSGPLPFTLRRSIPRSFAMRRASGEMRSPAGMRSSSSLGWTNTSCGPPSGTAGRVLLRQPSPEHSPPCSAAAAALAASSQTQRRQIHHLTRCADDGNGGVNRHNIALFHQVAAATTPSKALSTSTVALSVSISASTALFCYWFAFSDAPSAPGCLLPYRSPAWAW